MKCTTIVTAATLVVTALMLSVSSAAGQYKQINLVANEKGKAIRADAHVVNAWGLAFFPHGPFWISDQVTGVATVYGHFGKPIPLVVTIPAAPSAPSGPVGSPTGIVANPTSDFGISKEANSGPALFVLDTLDGTISGWNPSVDPTNAIITVDFSTTKPNRPFAASYTGLATGQNSKGQNILYAVDSGISPTITNNEVDMFDANFNLVGSFRDPNVPFGMTAYGIQNVNGKLIVTFTGFAPPFGGVVDVFDTDGNLLTPGHFAADDVTGPLQAPWGIALAPHDFGVFSNALLLGNVADGRISAFDPNTGTFLGQLADDQGRPISASAGFGLWGLAFGTDAQVNGKPNQLFFTAGPSFPPHTGEYADGLFGVIIATGHGHSPDGP
jgi:uncharacterized protein (TIGR03118 family)